MERSTWRSTTRRSKRCSTGSTPAPRRRNAASPAACTDGPATKNRPRSCTRGIDRCGEAPYEGTVLSDAHTSELPMDASRRIVRLEAQLEQTKSELEKTKGELEKTKSD